MSSAVTTLIDWGVQGVGTSQGFEKGRFRASEPKEW
jgi:hypothetical protein